MQILVLNLVSYCHVTSTSRRLAINQIITDLVKLHNKDTQSASNIGVPKPFEAVLGLQYFHNIRVHSWDMTHVCVMLLPNFLILCDRSQIKEIFMASFIVL